MKVEIQQNGVVKSIPRQEAKVLVLLGKAKYVAKQEQAQDVQVDGDVVINAVEPEKKPKRGYKRKDMAAE